MDDSFMRIGQCDIALTARVSAGAIIGKPFRPLLETESDALFESGPTVIRENAFVGYHAVVGSGSVLAPGVIVDDYCAIESDVTIGERSLLIYRAQICNEAEIGAGCVIGGFVAERVVVADGVRIFGKVVHSQHDPTVGWDAPQAVEPSAILEAGAFVGFDALVIGGVRLGAGAYVCANSVVTRDVPARHIAYGVNKILPFDEWPGILAKSPFFHGRHGGSREA